MRTGDVTKTVDSASAALDVAAKILRLGKHGMGKPAPATVWESMAEGPLAALLYAAGPRGVGAGLAWARAAVRNLDPDDSAIPGWGRAAQICAREHTVLGWNLMSVIQLDPRERDSIALTIAAALDEFSTPPGVAAAVPA